MGRIRVDGHSHCRRQWMSEMKPGCGMCGLWIRWFRIGREWKDSGCMRERKDILNDLFMMFC